jgi:hypothetical protein
MEALKGIKFPADKDGIVEYAQQNDADEAVIRVLEALPDDDYNSSADLAKGFSAAVGGLRVAEGHASASEVTSALKGIHFPCSKEDLKKQAVENGADDEVLRTIDRIPTDEFASAVDISRGLHAAAAA